MSVNHSSGVINNTPTHVIRGVRVARRLKTQSGDIWKSAHEGTFDRLEDPRYFDLL